MSSEKPSQQNLNIYPGPQKYSSQEFQFRYLDETDINRGFFQVLEQLTKAPKPNAEDFKKYWAQHNACHTKHIQIVGVDRKNDKIVAAGTILITHSVLDGKVGKIQNIVTCKSVRGKGLGKIIIEILKDEGYRQNCNVISLFCEQKNVKFYQKLQFKTQGMISACYKE